MCNETIETLIANLEIANKGLFSVTGSKNLNEKELNALLEAYDLVKRSIRLLSDEEISMEIDKYSSEE